MRESCSALSIDEDPLVDGNPLPPPVRLYLGKVCVAKSDRAHREVRNDEAQEAGVEKEGERVVGYRMERVFRVRMHLNTHSEPVLR